MYVYIEASPMCVAPTIHGGNCMTKLVFAFYGGKLHRKISDDELPKE
jgi:hypothetical protein